jgi:hypothetical protein
LFIKSSLPANARLSIAFRDITQQGSIYTRMVCPIDMVEFSRIYGRGELSGTRAARAAATERLYFPLSGKTAASEGVHRSSQTLSVS